MGKAKEKRIKARQKYLTCLAHTDPALFLLKWKKRLKSWRDESTSDHSLDGNATLAKALIELKLCGPEAFTLALQVTLDFFGKGHESVCVGNGDSQ